MGRLAESRKMRKRKTPSSRIVELCYHPIDHAQQAHENMLLSTQEYAKENGKFTSAPTWLAKALRDEATFGLDGRVDLRVHVAC